MSEEIEQKEEEKPQREEIPVPLYFDRYVAGELRSLRDGIAALDRRLVDFKEFVDERFVHVDRRIDELKESMNERFVQFEKRMDERSIQVDKQFANLKESIDERFVQFDRRFVELKEGVDKRFDKSDATVKWVMSLFFPVIGGILALIVKVFFFGP